MGWLSRHRHRKGFGVHSPFAYRVVKDIIAPSRKYRYYAEEAIAGYDSPSRQITRLALMVHRLVGRYNYRIKVSALSPSVETLMRYAAETASRVPSADASVLLITSAPFRTDTLTRVSQDGITLLILSPFELAAPPRTGVLFHDTRAALYFPYEKTAFVAYDIRF